MSTWFISDLHFGHKNIIKYSNRPFSSIEEMNEILIQNWNKCVKPEDTIYNLGDFAFGDYKYVYETYNKLNGIKIHILGNHDKYIKNYVQGLIENQVLYGVHSYLETSINKQLIVLFHFGQRVWHQSHRGSIQLYGHSHGSLSPYGKSVDVGVDAPFIFPRNKPEDYRPINIDEVIEYMKDREITKPDHHSTR